MNVVTIDHIRKLTNTKLDPINKSKFGQYMTSNVIAEFMASLFSDGNADVKLLDCGAGIGSLTVAATKKLKNISKEV